MADELEEYREAEGLLARWSELSDVVYVYTQAHWSGHIDIAWPVSISGHAFWLGALYMFPKYTLRFLFFRRAGRRCDASRTVRSVRNPAKSWKLRDIALRHGLDQEKFVTICQRQLRWWPLLK